jgi:hypothetical protein
MDGNDMERRAGYGSWYAFLHGSLVHLKEQHQAGTASASTCQKKTHARPCRSSQHLTELKKVLIFEFGRVLASARESRWWMKHGLVQMFCDDARTCSPRDQYRGESSIRTTAANMLPTLHNSHTILQALIAKYRLIFGRARRLPDKKRVVRIPPFRQLRK